jgi:hypothetical protein
MPERRRKVLVDGSVPSVRRSVLFSSIGEVVEWFDFMVYLSLAPVLARVFFAADSRSSLLVRLVALAIRTQVRETPLFEELQSQHGFWVFFRHEVPISAGCRAVGPLCAVGFAEKFHSDFQVRQPARRWLLRMRRTLHK